MARQPRPAPEPVSDGVSSQSLAKINAASQELAAAEHLALGQSDLYRAVGRIEAAHFLETVSARMIGEAYLAARSLIGETGSLMVKTSSGERKRVSGLEEFCEAVMPVSARRCRQIAQAMHELGPALYEQAEQLGLGHRNYAAIRALPNEMKEQAKAAIASGNRDQVISLIEELSARNSSLLATAKEHEKTLSAKDRVIAGKDAKINKLVLAEEVRRNGKPDERESQQVSDVRDAGQEAELALQRLVAVVDEVTGNPATESSELQARQTLDWVAQRFADMCAERGIAVDVLGERVEPGWQREISETAEAAPARRRRA